MSPIAFLAFIAGFHALEEAAPGLVLLQSDAKTKRGKELPAVDKIVATSDTLKKIRTGTEMLKSSVEGKLTEHVERLTGLKSAYEKKLASQQAENDGIRAASEKLSEENNMLIHQNEVLRNYSWQLANKNNKLRSELQGIEKKLGSAKLFATNSLQTTEVSQDDVKTLQVQGLELKNMPNEQTLLSNLKNEETVDEAIEKLVKSNEYREKNSTSLLELNRELENNDASAVSVDLESEGPVGSAELRMMSDELNKLTAEEAESERKIKAAFSDQFQAGSNMRTTLLNQKRAREERHTSLVALQKNLQATQMRLQTIHTQLQQRLHGLGMFMKHISKQTGVSSA